MKKLILKVQSKMQGAKAKLLKRKKGEVNTVEVLVIIAVFLILTYPLYKSMISTFLNSVSTWFSTETKNIFTV
ncbi:hypothetical protein [Clostridium hydrogenum]|uniref:hypothetical protein n=1 Tax=Clostridium hydrogenum TaxID=2855764 RepID=UPI001F30FD0A|nr:hypothetical protein [Clostridium hydrogenum]